MATKLLLEFVEGFFPLQSLSEIAENGFGRNVVKKTKGKNERQSERNEMLEKKKMYNLLFNQIIQNKLEHFYKTAAKKESRKKLQKDKLPTYMYNNSLQAYWCQLFRQRFFFPLTTAVLSSIYRLHSEKATHSIGKYRQAIYEVHILLAKCQQEKKLN